ncbi:hypothetical protein B0H17DRAFT_1136251 [Mycena rosella]|uniref:Uncharacterized protein n=1 Tax=Mycena rosella TaxID=1033263 RepID=A0AAD7DB75_MYCRO|nr:hypothetical protein B0H17DRAFT_1136251 [Mycena rosella]
MAEDKGAYENFDDITISETAGLRLHAKVLWDNRIGYYGLRYSESRTVRWQAQRAHGTGLVITKPSICPPGLERELGISAIATTNDSCGPHLTIHQLGYIILDSGQAAGQVALTGTNIVRMDIVTPETFHVTPKPPRKKVAAQKPSPVLQTPSTNDTPSTQPRLRKKKRTQWEKSDAILDTIGKHFGSLGQFLAVLFYNHIPGVLDPRTKRHVRTVTAFLGGESTTTMDSSLEFAPPDVASPRDIDYARPCLSTWAPQTAGPELRRQVGVLTQNDPSDPTDRTQLRASTNGRAKNIRLVTWDEFSQLTIPRIAGRYKFRARALCSLTLSRNRYASGYLALPLAVWQFACKTHVDEKWIFSRFGFTVHDTTARACLDTLTDSSLAKLRGSVAEGIKNGTMRWQIILDNVQQYCRQRDLRLGREDVLKVGTAATEILLEDCAPGAFDLQNHLDLVIKQERRELTIDSLYGDINWAYIHELTALHWVRILVYFIPQLAYLCQEVTAAFNSEKMTKRRLPKGRKTVMQPSIFFRHLFTIISFKTPPTIREYQVFPRALLTYVLKPESRKTAIMQSFPTMAESECKPQGMMHVWHEFESQMGQNQCSPRLLKECYLVGLQSSLCGTIATTNTAVGPPMPLKSLSLRRKTILCRNYSQWRRKITELRRGFAVQDVISDVGT